VIDALARLPAAIKLRVIGYETVGHRGYVEELRHAARMFGVEDRIQILGVVPSRCELLNWCRQSDVGLAFMPKNSDDLNEQSMVGASNKPFDYLSSGLALLVSDRADWHTMFVDGGYGLACDIQSPESIAANIKWFLDNPKETRLMGERGRQKVLGTWNYEAQFEPALRMLRARQDEFQVA
jgi:glycosyltransferase involved in cell wall biosynthesis